MATRNPMARAVHSSKYQPKRIENKKKKQQLKRPNKKSLLNQKSDFFYSLAGFTPFSKGQKSMPLPLNHCASRFQVAHSRDRSSCHHHAKAKA